MPRLRRRQAIGGLVELGAAAVGGSLLAATELGFNRRAVDALGLERPDSVAAQITRWID